MEHRRQLLKNAAAALTASPLFVPRNAWGANDRLTYGVIGTGGRGRYLRDKFQKLGAQCVALCDVYEPFLAEAKKASPDAKTYLESNDLLAQKDLDFIVIATPDHQHYPNLLAALAAKKDVYQEKPFSHTLAESQKMIQAVRKTDRIVQVGMQRRSAPIVVQGCCNAGKPPLSAVSYGQLHKMEGAETPDVVSAVFEYPAFTATWTLNYCSAFNTKPEIVFQGDAGSLVMTSEGFRVYKEPWDKPENQKPIREVLDTVEVEPHIQNFLDCVKSRREPNGTVEAGAAAAAAPQLANVAFRRQKQVRLIDGVEA